MATVIPALSTCASRMTGGERRLAERLEDKLDADYLVWYDVPVGPRHAHPDFVVLHPRRGLLILEAKDWKPGTLRRANRSTCEILTDAGLKTVPNPLEQARHYAHQVKEALERDAALRNAAGALGFPWSYGAVLTNVTRQQFDAAELQHAMEPHRVLCRDEMAATVDAEDFQSRLWDMFPTLMRGVLSLPQIDRVRWILFPEVRVDVQQRLFADATANADADAGPGGTEDELPLPDLMQVMDLQQEQLARSLGDGHRVIHGVAGSGKTMILGWRAEHLARRAPQGKPILVLCYNEPLATALAAVMEGKGLAARVHVRHFHRWCRQQLVAFGQALPPQGPLKPMFEAMVANVIRGVDRGQIPSGQYQAVLIDEGHDFEAAWLKLVAQMVDPATNSLLVLYDDAQSIYQRRRAQQFSFRSVGIQAQGRTTVLKINYRNTRQILRTASALAHDLLVAKPDATRAPVKATAGDVDTGGMDGMGDMGDDEDRVVRLQPMSSGRDGDAAVVVRLPGLRDEPLQIAEWLLAEHREGRAWGEMAVLCRHRTDLRRCAAMLSRRAVPHEVREGAGQFHPRADTVKVMTMHASKGLEFSVVTLAGVGRMPEGEADEADEARLFYVAATRATRRLYVPLAGDGVFARRLSADTRA